MADFARSPCPIASTLDVVGDRWSLLIVRDLLVGKRRFGQFLESEERIPTNILAARLKRMQETGLLTREPYRRHPPRYEYALSAKGAALLPVLQEICRWAGLHLPGTWSPPPGFMGEEG